VAFLSVLFDPKEADRGPRSMRSPECFRDLNLDQIVLAITAGREEYALEPIFYEPLHELGTIRYRHEIFHDLEERGLFAHIQTFADALRAVRKYLTEFATLRHQYQKQRALLDAVILYGQAVVRLNEDLGQAALQSRGLKAVREYLAGYIASAKFSSAHSRALQVRSALLAIHYDLDINGGRVEVSRHETQPDYGESVRRAFAEFEQGDVETYSFKFHEHSEVNAVEARILDRVALLYRQEFEQLTDFCDHNQHFVDEVIRRFDQEAQFYVACLEYVDNFKPAGLPFCYPDVSDGPREVSGEEVFDLALAEKFLKSRARVVTNAFELRGPERVLVVSGANQGGKTTFARACGQLHYLASLGCPVPAKRAALPLFDELFTHFEREEVVQSLTGKLEEELLRMHDILEHATARSILIMNETFGATTLSDAVFLGKCVLGQIIERGMLCVCVTFIEELASLDAATVSMVSMVDPKDPAVRTFKIIRKAADGVAHALAIAQKYRLSYQDVKERLAQ
jgi:DNA mismatch repair protein MutS